MARRLCWIAVSTTLVRSATARRCRCALPPSFFVPSSSSSSVASVPRRRIGGVVVPMSTSTTSFWASAPPKKRPLSAVSAASAAAPRLGDAQRRDNFRSPPLVVIVAGPTAVGKSAVATSLCRPRRAGPLLLRPPSVDVTAKRGGGGNSVDDSVGDIEGEQEPLVGHVVSADSVQAYEGVSIGANKPTDKERIETPHHLLDVVDASSRAGESYNAAEWMRDAIYVVKELTGVGNGGADEDAVIGDATEDYGESSELEMRRHKISEGIDASRTQSSPLMCSLSQQPILPVVVGGTMMYLQWLVHGRPDAVRPTADAVRRAADTVGAYQAMDDDDEGGTSGDASIEAGNAEESNRRGWDAAIAHASSLGPTFAQRVQTLCGRDWYRLRRTLEVAYTVLGEEETGNTYDDGRDIGGGQTREERIDALYSGLRSGGLEDLGRYDVRCFFLCPDDRMRHAKSIDERCEEMLLRGLIRETATLRVTGRLPEGGQAARAIGYRQALEYLQRPGPKREDGAALVRFVEEFATATRRYAKKQMQWFRRDDKFLFVPVSLAETVEARVEAAADIITDMCLLLREDYEKELVSMAGATNADDSRQKGEHKCTAKEESLPLSALTKLANENQGKGMKFYASSPQKILEGTPEFVALLAEADECTALVQGLGADFQ